MRQERRRVGAAIPPQQSCFMFLFVLFSTRRILTLGFQHLLICVPRQNSDSRRSCLLSQKGIVCSLESRKRSSVEWCLHENNEPQGYSLCRCRGGWPVGAEGRLGVTGLPSTDRGEWPRGFGALLLGGN